MVVERLARDTIDLMTLVCSMLYVKDLGRMREFYGNLLHAQPVNTAWAETWALFDVGGGGFALHTIPDRQCGEIDSSSQPPERKTSSMKLIFGVEDVTAERARLEALGALALQRSWQEPVESCDCVDPEGNIFQIASSVHLPRLLGRR